MPRAAARARASVAAADEATLPLLARPEPPGPEQGEPAGALHPGPELPEVLPGRPDALFRDHEEAELPAVENLRTFDEDIAMAAIQGENLDD